MQTILCVLQRARRRPQWWIGWQRFERRRRHVFEFKSQDVGTGDQLRQTGRVVKCADNVTTQCCSGSVVTAVEKHESHP